MFLNGYICLILAVKPMHFDIAKMNSVGMF